MSAQMSKAQRNANMTASRTQEQGRSALDNLSGTVPKSSEEVQQQIDAIAARGQQYTKGITQQASQQAKQYKGPAKSWINTLVGYTYTIAGAGAGFLAGSFYITSNLLKSLGSLLAKKKEEAKKEVKKQT